LQVSSVSPQGEVASVRQVVVKFDQAAITFGDPKAPAPMALRCDDTSVSPLPGRWTSERQWVAEFTQDLPPGVRCTLSPVAGFRGLGGATLGAAASYAFNTGGPFVRRIRPGGGDVEEQQVFVLALNGPATLESLREHVWCQADDLGERIPIKLVEGDVRQGALTASGNEKAAAKAPLNFATLQCNRTLTPGSELQLVYGTGVATPSGVANTVEKRYRFEVRAPLTASFSCERENAQADCLPLRPLTLRFSAPVTRQLAAQVTLKGEHQTHRPRFDERAGDDTLVEEVRFAPPFAENAQYRIELPASFQDASGRPLAETDAFPMQVATGAMPPLAKFAASPFGVVERLAEPDGVAIMPITVRRIEPALAVQAWSPAQISSVQPDSDADIIAWYRKIKYYDQAYNVQRKIARHDVKGPLPRVIDKNDDSVQSRMVSLLAGQSGVKALEMPKADGTDPRPFEVIGVPLQPGFHVLEVASRKLGDALLDEQYGGARTMYVRTSVLATNLAVHFKLGRENSLAWVTSLDKGAVVAGARVQVSDCRGKPVASGTSDANGIVQFSGIAAEPPTCSDSDDGLAYSDAYFVSARARDAAGVDDLAFTWSDWQRGIEPWRFNLPTSQEVQPDRLAHTVLDRMLFRAGETVSMKHLLRTAIGTANGFGVPPEGPSTLVITHLGSGQQYKQPLKWRRTATGGLDAESSFAVPVAAKLGEYSIELRAGKGGDDDGPSLQSGHFRVEEFRLPVLQGRIGPSDSAPLVAAQAVPLDVQVNYVAGGAASGLPVRVSALVRGKAMNFPDFDDYSFAAPNSNDDAMAEEDEPATGSDARVVADKLATTLDREGLGHVRIAELGSAATPRELLLEASYADPNGEVQTLRSTQTLWPAAVIAGIRTEGWVSVGDTLRFRALALGLDGKPKAGVPIDVSAVAHVTTTSRKRLVGGFYTYDNHSETQPLGTVCSGRSDAFGLLQCETQLKSPGRIELVASASDEAGHASLAADSVYVTNQGEVWFGGQDNDRIDVLPEKKSYAAGEVARLQVRMPFRAATALVTVEREGVLASHVVQLQGQDPSFSLEMKPEWGPNVYVSVLALRGRLREVPWYSFFTWGYKAPREWWTAFWHEGRRYVAPTALVDLSKPAYRFGVAEVKVDAESNRIVLRLAADKPSYPVRSKAQVTITGTLPNGQPAAGAEVAVAAVDEALLELMPNTSWQLLDAMMQRRSWGVSTSTAQMEIVGRRHYGRKAVAPGGGGGKTATRELLDTLLLWNPRVVLDAQGQATVTVPLNDALSTFRVTAVADRGPDMFGQWQTTLTTTQDLQIISGLPPLVREDDRFRAQVTLRNTTAKAMKVEVTPRATLLSPGVQTVDIPPGEAREVAWEVSAPAQAAQSRVDSLLWVIEAKDLLGDATDALKLRQRIVPSVPMSVQQATLVQLDGPYTLDVAPPADALPGRGGVRMALQPRLAEGLPGVRAWFADYPYACLEQKASKAIGLRDGAAWRALGAALPAYLDGDGLANYFPPRDGEGDRGSDILTSYLVAASDAAARIDPAFALPPDSLAQMEQGLVKFVEGRIERKFWSPRNDLDVRKLAAIEALSRHGKASARMLESITLAPNQWPTSALIDWLQILQRLDTLPQRAQRLREANTLLQSRLNYQGTRVGFSTEQDDNWWWLMANGDVNTARLMLAVMDDPAWEGDMGKLANGFIGRQQGGAWHTTTANLWGSLALDSFSARFESTPVSGSTIARVGGERAAVDWRKVERVKASDAEGAAHATSAFGAPSAPGELRNNAMFLPWAAGPGGQPVHDALLVLHEGTGKPWLTLQSMAAVPLKEAFSAGYTVKKTITPIEQARPGKYTRGDILRVTLEVNASADMTWVALTDPVPGGSTILGSGLGRDSQIATQGEKSTGNAAPAFEERSFEAYRSYYEYLPKGTVTAQYTVRLNNVGDFALPPTRVEALYAPEMFGEAPNARIQVEAAP